MIVTFCGHREIAQTTEVEEWLSMDWLHLFCARKRKTIPGLNGFLSWHT